MVFFIDYENTGPSGFFGNSVLDKTDELFVYCRKEHIPRVNDCLKKIQAKSSIRIITETTKNALDFILISDLMAMGPGRIYCIVSKDKGYEAAINNARRHKVYCQRINSVGERSYDFLFCD